MNVTRRDFLKHAALSAAGLEAARLPTPVATAAAPLALRIGVVETTPRSPSAAARADGLQLGLEEATHAAALFGGRIRTQTLRAGEIAAANVAAVLGGDDAEQCAALSEQANERKVLYVNVSCASDALRGAGCRRTTFHVAPSDAMLRDALAQSQAPSGARAVAWMPVLERFGADTLNQRFRARFGRPMTADAWTAWLATKILWESSLRARSGDAGALLEYLERETTQFDGHKGRPLSFRSWDHQLRQPLYVVTAAAPNAIVELPVAGADESSRDALDRLGTRREASACRLTS